MNVHICHKDSCSYDAVQIYMYCTEKCYVDLNCLLAYRIFFYNKRSRFALAVICL